MVACDSTLQTLAFDGESSWAEDVDTVTYAVTLTSPVNLTGITQSMIVPERVTARRLDGSKGIPGTFNGSLSFECYLTGFGSTTASTTGAINDLYYLIGCTIGASSLMAGSGTTLTGGTANIPTTTASGTFASGLCRIGALGDGDGDGQFYAISSHSTTNLTLLTNLHGAPANGAVLYSGNQAYAASSSCTLTGMRFRVQTADGQWVLHGCFPTSFSVTGLNPGEVPKCSFTYGFSWAEPISATFPTTPNAQVYTPSPVTADGSCFYNSVGTATFAQLSIRQFSIDYSLGVSPITGGAGVNAYQTITGATRTRDSITVNLTVDAEGASATPTYWDAWLANVNKHLLYTLNAKDGQAVGIYFRNLCWAGNRPTQSSTNGRNTIPLQFMAYNSTTTTSDLTLSPMIIAGS